MASTVPFPTGDDATDTLINGFHYNRTTLAHWNYALYSNGTLSNESSCWLVFSTYNPVMLPNGTFVNGTSCDVSINPIRTRGILGLVFGTLFILTVVLTLVNLREHGRRYLAHEKRWSAVGRRWQWYWMLFLAACGAISTFTAVGVDQDFLLGTSIILQSLFYYLMLPGLLACVWESIRHWVSWQERQICDADPFSPVISNSRGRTEVYIPIIFYILDCMMFFMAIPRSWTAIRKQNSPEQTINVARPAALDGRFKACAILGLAAWAVTCFSLLHGFHHYWSNMNLLIGHLRSRSNDLQRLIGGVIAAAVAVGYSLANTWLWSISPLNANVSNSWLYGLGYGPCLFVLVIYNFFGLFSLNDDKALMMQRQSRDRRVDNSPGYERMPQGLPRWSKKHGDSHHRTSAKDPLRALATNIGGGPATARNIERGVEMRLLTRARSGNDSTGHNDDQGDHAGLGSGYGHTESDQGGDGGSDIRKDPGVTGSSLRPKPQVVKSMLDI